MKRLLHFVIVLHLALGFVSPVAAQTATTLLPGANSEISLPKAKVPEELRKKLNLEEVNGAYPVRNCVQLSELKRYLGSQLSGYYLVSKIKCGSMQVGDVPYYIKHALEFFIWIAGSIAVIMVMVGGYQYAVGGITENKADGKKTITSALIGLIIVLLAWVIVNIMQSLLTVTTSYETPVAALFTRLLS